MTTTLFDTFSHTDFLRLTLEAFSRQGYKVEQSAAAGADGVLIGKNGARIGILCKKYRGAFIGRPVLQQFYSAMEQAGCKEGYLITTTDCSPDAYEFANGKGISLYNRERTTGLLKAAFGDEFMRSGRMPELGATARAVPAAVRPAASVASYEKVSAPELKNAREPERPPVSMKAPEPVRPPAPVTAPEPEKPPVPGPAAAPEPVQAPEPEQASEQVPAPQEETAVEELPEEVLTVESIESPGAPEAGPPENMTTIVCAECNHHLRVPTDKGMITVTCTECGLRWLYLPETNSDGEVKRTTIIACKACSQQLNVPTNRGQLNVRCPKCGEKWLFTP